MNKSTPSAMRIAALKARLMRFDCVCSGNLRSRSTVCGAKNCRCKAHPPEHHGPYYYWSRLLDGKVVQRILSPADAKIVARGIKNQRQVKKLLREWEEETVRALAISGRKA